ncbi:MAG: hypothetical protein KJ630_17390 [Proteobacteria bacterium]|nr:hypothetical protein [Pseudomonadota bacterium]
MKAHAFKTVQLIVMAVFFFTVLSSSFLTSAQADFQRTKIAVLDFELIGGKLETTGMGAILSEWFITSIVKSGRFDVVERAMLQKIISEQKLSSTGIIDENSATALGKILGVKVVITGSVLNLRDTIEINSRVISVESGSIIAAENIRGGPESDLHNLVDQLTTKIMRNFPLTGYVVKKNPTSVIIDLGLDAGLSSGTEFVIYKEGEVIKHPKTGEVLDVEQIVTGKLRITRVSKNVAEGDIISQDPSGIAYGQLVKSVQKESATPTPPQERKKAAATPVIKEVAQSPTPTPVSAPAPPPKPVQEIKQNKKKIAVAVPEPSRTNDTPAPSTIPPPAPKEQSAIPEKAGEYKAAIFHWELFGDANGFAGILLDRTLYQIADIPGLTLTHSYYKTKGVAPLTNVAKGSLFNGNTPNLATLRQVGKEIGINVAILGRMNIYCRWSDNCQVRNMDYVVVNLATGKIYTEAGTNWDMGARDYIELLCSKVFDKFAVDMKK